MKLFTRTALMLGVVAAIGAGTMFTSVKAFADTTGQGTKGCCENCVSDPSAAPKSDPTAAAPVKKEAAAATSTGVEEKKK